MQSAPIAFRTWGWRGILSEDFTFSNLRRLSRAVARSLRKQGGRRSPRIFIGYDTRFLAQDLAREVASVLETESVHPTLSTRFTPTPVVSHAVVQGGFDAGIQVSASHYPAEFSGLILSDGQGAPASPQLARHVEALASEIRDGSAVPAGLRSEVKVLDPWPAYRKAIHQRVRSRVLAAGKLKLVCDPLHGAGAGYLSPLFSSAARVTTIRDTRDVLFEGMAPACGERQLAPLVQEVRRSGAHLGIATDGDGGRFGVVDRGGRLFPESWSWALLADYLLETRGDKLGIARSVATTRLLDDVAAFRGAPLFETQVGSEAFRQLLTDGQVIMACDEDSGMAMQGHVPRSDGLLGACLMAEMVAFRKKSLQQQIDDLFRRVGPRHFRRESQRLDAEQWEDFRPRLESPPEAFSGKKVVEHSTKDGALLQFHDRSWLLLRPSEHAPIVHCYAEARTARDAMRLIDAARAWVQTP
jgi:phosphoglucomutase